MDKDKEINISKALIIIILLIVLIIMFTKNVNNWNDMKIWIAEMIKHTKETAENTKRLADLSTKYEICLED